MKFGILTYHTPCNFGANLQSYTTVKFFTSLGYDVKVINYVRQGDIDANYCDNRQRTAHWYFSQSLLPVTKAVDSNHLVSLIDEEGIDVIVLGADAIWNKNSLEVFGMAWLWRSHLADRVKVVCLSPAFMGDTYLDLPINVRNEFRDSLLRMSYVNTRDEWTRNIVNNEIIGRDYIKVINPDPVFLLNNFCEQKWENGVSLIESKKYYIVSFPHNFIAQRCLLKKIWVKVFKYLVNRRGYKLVELPIPEGVSGLNFDYTVPYPIDPLQWYLWLKNAKGFVGLRFHAVVSCISAGVPFFSLDIYGKSNRLARYLNAFGIHFFDRRINVSSKIRNLLEGSGLEKNRINGSKIHMVSPFKVFKMLENQNIDDLHIFKEQNVLKFRTNMKEMLSIVEGKNE